MILNDRQKKIFEIIKKEKSVPNKLIQMQLYISESTLRRDLIKLEQNGVIVRTHGNSSLIESSSTESSILVRVQTRIKEKHQIALSCLPLLSKNESYFVDSSSTAGYVLSLMTGLHNITIITNGLHNASLATSNPNVNAQVHLPGGNIYSNTNSILGATTVEYIKNFNCNAFIFSCGGISLSSGITEASLEQSLVKKQMLKNSKIHILLADQTKFDKIFLCTSCDFEDIDYIITDKTPNEHYIEAFNKAGVELIIAK